MIFVRIDNEIGAIVADILITYAIDTNEIVIILNSMVTSKTAIAARDIILRVGNALVNSTKNIRYSLRELTLPKN